MLLQVGGETGTVRGVEITACALACLLSLAIVLTSNRCLAILIIRSCSPFLSFSLFTLSLLFDDLFLFRLYLELSLMLHEKPLLDKDLLIR